MAKNVKHYRKDGTIHGGGMHKMSNGAMHSGAKHTKTSQPLFHFGGLSKAAQAKAKTQWGKSK